MAEATSKETHWEKAAKTRMGKYLTKIETDFILNSISFGKTKTIMDVGAEAGKFSLLATKNESEVVGIDINSIGLKRLKLKSRIINIIQADARRIPLRNETLDAVIMIEVLDYIPEIEEALAECYRTLKTEASLILSFGNKSSLKSTIRRLSRKSYQHSYRKVAHSLCRTGFTTKSKTGYNWLPFSRMSENPLVPILAKMEKLFRLRDIPSLSPWIIMHAVKSK